MPVPVHTSQQQAVATTASLAGQHSSRVTILFVDEGGKELDASTRIEQIKGYATLSLPPSQPTMHSIKPI